MTETAEKIMEAARQCFFQHGFTRSNMSMFAEYAGCSRVTLYKYFKTKEDLFREMSFRYLQDRLDEFRQLMELDLSFWQRLEAVITAWVVSPFEMIANDVISNDLVSAANRLNADVHDEKEARLGILLSLMAEEAVVKGEICIDRLGIRPEELADAIMLMMNGMIGMKIKTLRDNAERIVTFLRRSLQPQR